MADTTTQNNAKSTTYSVAAAGGFHNLTFSNSGTSGLKWVVITNLSNANVTIAFATSANTGGLYLVPGATSQVLPGPWYGFYASHDGVGSKTIAVLGQY